tara:strand:- start:68 stop:304 length:237 start_codon:yes stop_codon:yes gene_type:complete
MAKKATRGGSGLISGDLFQSILGMFGFYQIDVCTQKDETFYCKVMRFFKLFIVFVIFVIIIYFVYSIFFVKKTFFGGK